MRSLLFTFLILLNLQSFSQDTFSIIAVDPETGEVGAAGATCLFGQSEGNSAKSVSYKVIKND